MRTSHQPVQSRARKWTALCAGIALSGSIALSPLMTSAQQATPASSPIASPVARQQQPPTITPLMAYTFTDFPAAPMTLRLLRITLAPGAAVPMHTHPGPEFDRVESGVLTADSDGGAQISTAGAKPAAMSGKTATLNANDWILFPKGSGMMLTNKGKENLVLLSAVVLPVGADAPASITYADGTPSAAEFEGVSFTVLGDGLLQKFPTGSATVSVDQISVPAGVDLPANPNPAMLSRIAGNFSFKVKDGDVQVTRTATPGLQQNEIPDSEFTLGTGDAAFFPSGVAATSRTGESAPLSYYQLQIQPSSSMTSDSADITWLAAAPAASTPAASPAAATVSTATAAATQTTPKATTPASGGIPKGTTVTINEDGVNMRAEPSTDAESVNQVDTGVKLTVVAGPETADGNTWYQLNLPEDPQGDWSTGWVSQAFFDVPNGTATPSASSTPQTNASPSGSPTATKGAFEEGDTVVTTDDNARVRDSATTDGSIIDAFPAGTEMRITGGAVEADGYTWYPVEVVGADVTGWIASDFITLAPGQ